MLLAPALARQTPVATTFDMNGLQLDVSSAQIRAAFPTVECEASCVGEGATYLGSMGKSVAVLRDGKATLLALRFGPVPSDSRRVHQYRMLENTYGPPTLNLGVPSCNEWSFSNDFLAACLDGEMNHLVFSGESWLDANKHGPSP